MSHTIQNGSGPDSDFWTQMSSQTPRMCVCIYVEPASIWGGALSAIAFTSNSRDMTLPGYSVTFKAAPSITPTTVESALNEPGTVEVLGAYLAESFDEDEVLNGKWDGAKVRVLVACWDDTTLGQWVVHEGDLGQFESFQTYFRAESRGYIARLNNEVSKATSRLCRVKEFRDSECGHTNTTVDIGGTAYNITTPAFTGLTVGVVVDRYTLYFNKEAGAANDWPTGFFDHGTIIANSTTVDLGSIKRAIKEHANGASYHEIILRQPFPFTVTAGDTFDLVAGCDRTLEDCLLYGNVVNFRGEPYVPGIEAANRVGTIR